MKTCKLVFNEHWQSSITLLIKKLSGQGQNCVTKCGIDRKLFDVRPLFPPLSLDPGYVLVNNFNSISELFYQLT